MKKWLIIVAMLTVAACSPKNGSKDQDPLRAKGGVDVGNMTLALVPQTNASISFPINWSSDSTSNVLSIKNKSGSSIEVKKSEISDLSSPSATGLQLYLKTKYPNRSYKIVSFNGFEGVRAELIDTSEAKSSDLYVISELKDFIHIQSHLKKSDNGIAEGDDIILSVRVKYQGVPYINAQVKTITLAARAGSTSDHRYAYSFWGDCYTYSDQACNPSGGVAVMFERSFQIGASGYDHGRVVELGPESQIPFDSIRVEGDYLVAPLSNIPISDIYTAFTPKDLQKDQDSIELKAGHVYLVRTISWPDEDLITKMYVKKVNGGLSAEITYQKLVYVQKDVMQKQIDFINKNTIENEMPISNGEVMLYNQSAFNNYFYASFNFRYSTSGNMFITSNGWDLKLSNGCSGNLSFSVPHTGYGIGQVNDLGIKDLSSVSLTDFPDPNNFKRDCGIAVIKGHTYSVYHYDYGDDAASAIFGAVQVVDVDPANKWARLKFQRIKVASADYFQKWQGLAIPQEIQKVVLEKTNDGLAAKFYPFINKRGDQGSHSYEEIDFSANAGSQDYLSTESRPYGNKRGFYKLGNNLSIENVTVADVEALKGKFNRDVRFTKGDVIAVLLDNFYDRTVMVMRVDEHKQNQFVVLSIKYLERAKAPYSVDRN